MTEYIKELKAIINKAFIDIHSSLRLDYNKEENVFYFYGEDICLLKKKLPGYIIHIEKIKKLIISQLCQLGSFTVDFDEDSGTFKVINNK